MDMDPRYNAMHVSMLVSPAEGSRDRLPHAHHLYHLARRPRPPGRVRLSVASVLARAAARLAKEPVVALPRRA